MSDFEDRELRDRLQRLGGHGADTDEAFARLQRGVQRARRRRSVSMLTGLGVIVVLALSAALYANRTSSQVSPADGGTDSETSTNVSGPGTGDTNQGTSNTDDTDDTANSGDSEANETESVPPATGGAPNKPPSITTTTASGVNESKTSVSQGGSITVTLHNGVLALIDLSAYGGYEFEIEDAEPFRIRVRFENSDGHSRIEATITASGHISFLVSESYSGADDTSTP